MPEREVEIVPEDPSGDLVGIEVEASATVRRRDLAGLAYLRDHLSGRFRVGIVVYAGQRTLPFGDRLFAAPLQALWS